MLADSPVALLRYLHEGPPKRAFDLLDPGGRTRTGTTRMDSPALYQLSYPGVVSEVYGESSAATKCSDQNTSFGDVARASAILRARVFGNVPRRHGGRSWHSARCPPRSLPQSTLTESIIYRVRWDDLDQYRDFLYDLPDAAPPELTTFDGVSKADWWQPQPIYSELPRLEAPDFWHLWGCATIVMSPTVVEEIAGFLHPVGELLPLRCFGYGRAVSGAQHSPRR